MKTLITTILLALTLHAYANDLTPKEKSDFVDYYRTWRKLLKEFPDKPEVWVLFTDVNADGVLEAIATSYGERYEDGSIWTIFQRTATTWTPVKHKMKDATTVDPDSSFFARSDEFYALAPAGGAPELTIIHKNYDRLVEGSMASPLTSKVSITSDGFVKTEKLPLLDQLIAYSQTFQKLERLKVETFK